LSQRDTVAVETPAAAATSRTVARLLSVAFGITFPQQKTRPVNAFSKALN
jgi:hypothetical protein